MFESIRQHKKYLMGFLMILIIPSFVLFGVEGYSNANEGGKAVAAVNGQDIKAAEWDAAHQAQIERLQQAMPTIDIKMLDTPEARYAALENLVQQRVMAVAAQDLRVFTSDQRLQRDLQSNEIIASMRLPDGKLDMEAYRALLARQGMSPEMFEVVEMAVPNWTPAMLDSTKEVAQMELVRDIPAGAVLQGFDAKKAILVKQGQMAQLTLGEGKGFQISVKVEALQDGRLGEQIRLKNAESGKILSGVVSGASAVRGI